MSAPITPILQWLAAAVFALALIHAFSTRHFERLAHTHPQQAGLWHLLGEVEVVFGLWACVLMAISFGLSGRTWTLAYLESRNFTEPLFVFVVMVIAASRPVLFAVTWLVNAMASSIPLPTLTLSFWMTAMTTVVMGLLSFAFEFDRWQEPSATHWASILYNAVLVFGFAHAAWFYLARSLPPVASTLSVMMIPILGVFSGAWALNETLHWQDWAAMGLMVVSIASVLWPAKPANAQD